CRDPAADILDLDGVEQIRNATSRYKLAKTFFWNCPCTACIRTTDEDALHCVSRRLASCAAGPCRYRSIEPLALKPSRISAGNMHRQLKAARSRLPKLISSTQQALSVGCACVVEVDLLWIWLVICKPVLDDPPLLLSQQPLG